MTIITIILLLTTILYKLKMIIDAVDVLHQIIIVTVIIQITMIDVDFIFRYRFGMKNVF